MKKYILFILLGAGCSTAKNSTVSENQPRNTAIVAHRGAWKANPLPENSIASLQEAISLRYDGSEFDVRATADDSLVIHHDPHINNLLIENTPYKVLTQYPLSNGEKLPTLREYISAAMQHTGKTKLVCEIKKFEVIKTKDAWIAQKVLDLFREGKAMDKVIFISFNYSILKNLLALDPTLHTQYLGGDVEPIQLSRDGIRGADYHISVFKSHPEWIQQALKHHILLNAWTVDKTKDMDWLLQNGFDYITTNEPGLLRERIRKLKS